MEVGQARKSELLGADPILEDPSAGLEVPEALRASLERHRANLAQLVRNLKSAGVSETQIEASVSVLVESYRQELLRAIRSMVR